MLPGAMVNGACNEISQGKFVDVDMNNGGHVEIGSFGKVRCS